jgi:hypothetical protein
MVDFNILIASHFHSQLRYDLFLETIKSLANQTYKPMKILLSYSKNDDVKTDIENLFNSYFSVKNIDFFINYSKERLYQFDHFYSLFKSNEINGNWICFCDDDDMYLPNRLEIIKNIIQSNDDKSIETYSDNFFSIDITMKYEKLIELINSKNNNLMTSISCDFANSIINYDKFNYFFESRFLMIKNQLELNKTFYLADGAFKMYLNDCNYKKINETLYARRLDTFVPNYRCWDK